MYFGEKTYSKPARGKVIIWRQLGPLLLLVLVGALLLSFYLTSQQPGQTSTFSGVDRPPTAAPIGIPLEDDLGIDGLILEPTPPEDPEPFTEDPSKLAIAGRRDRTRNIEELTLAYLLQKLRSVESQLDEMKPALSLRRTPEEKRRVFSELIARPDEHRGKLIEVAGNVVEPEPGRRPLQLRGIYSPNPSGLDRVFQSYLYGSDDKFYLIATYKKARELSHLDGVSLRGYFCQLYKGDVEVRGQPAHGIIPVLVGVDYKPISYERPPSNLAPYIPIVIFVPLLGLGVVGYLLYRSDVRYRRLRQSSRKLRRRRLELDRKPPPEGEPSGGDSDPPAKE